MRSLIAFARMASASIWNRYTLALVLVVLASVLLLGVYPLVSDVLWEMRLRRRIRELNTPERLGSTSLSRIWSRRPRIDNILGWCDDWLEEFPNRMEREWQQWKPIYLHRRELIARGLPQEKKIPVKCEIHRKPKYSCDVCQWDNIIEGRGRQQRPREGRARDRLDRIHQDTQLEVDRAVAMARSAYLAQQEAQRRVAAAMQQNVVQNFLAPNPTFSRLLAQAPQQQAAQQWSVPITFTLQNTRPNAGTTTSSAPCRYCGYFGVHICADPSRPR